MNTPVDGSIVPIPGAEEVHMPPVVVSVNAVVVPAHNTLFPLIGCGNGFTVTTAVMIQPVGKVYVTLAVPTLTPVTTPDDEPIDIVAELALHVPPVIASLSVVVRPTHTASGPEIAAGNGFTVSTAVT